MPTLSADSCLELAPLENALSGIAVGGSDGTRGSFALAYSGGMDSRFLAHAARLLGFEPHLLMAVGPQIPPEEEEYGESWALRNGLSFRKIEVDTLSLPLVAVNGKRRCYECKREIFSRLREALHEEGERLPLCDGTNASDPMPIARAPKPYANSASTLRWPLPDSPSLTFTASPPSPDWRGQARNRAPACSHACPTA